MPATLLTSHSETNLPPFSLSPLYHQMVFPVFVSATLTHLSNHFYSFWKLLQGASVTQAHLLVLFCLLFHYSLPVVKGSLSLLSLVLPFGNSPVPPLGLFSSRLPFPLAQLILLVDGSAPRHVPLAIPRAIKFQCITEIAGLSICCPSHERYTVDAWFFPSHPRLLICASSFTLCSLSRT